MARSLVIGSLVALAACSRASGSTGTDAATTPVNGSIAGHDFRARSAVLVRSFKPQRDGYAPQAPIVLLFATEVSCARWGAAELFEPHVRIRNLPNGDAPGRQRVWFDFCVAAEGSPRSLSCGIQSNEAWLDLEAGSRDEGARVRGTFEARRDASVKPDENGVLAGSIDMVVCDGDKLAGLKLVPED